MESAAMTRAFAFVCALCVPTATGVAQLTQWRLLEPQARTNHAMVYDSARSVAVMFGGIGEISNTAFDETWEWTGNAWTQRRDPGPGGRFDLAMAYDSSRGVSVMFGGRTIVFTGTVTTAFGDLWERSGTTWTQRVVAGPSARYRQAMAYDSTRGVVVMQGGADHNGRYLDEMWEWNGTS